MRSLCVFLILAAASLAGCVSIEQVNSSFRSVDRIWQADYQRTEDEYRRRVVEADHSTVFAAVRKTLVDLGIIIRSESRPKGEIITESIAPTPLTRDEWREVASRESPQLRAISGGLLYMSDDPSGYNVHVRATVSPIRTGSLITLDIRVNNPSFERQGIYGARFAPPTAVQLATARLWDSLATNLQAAQLAQPRKLNASEGTARIDTGSASTRSAEPSATSVSGTGFAITADGHIVTNEHVVASCKSIEVRHPTTRDRLSANLMWSDKRNDIAVIKVAGSFPVVAEFRLQSLRAGESIVAFGYPLAGLLSSDGVVSDGLVAATSGIGDDATRLQISAAVQPGSSGGPLLDENGAVAGVVVSKLDALKLLKITGDIPQNINFAIKGEVVRLLLDTFGVKYTISKASSKSATNIIAERAKSFSAQITCFQR